MSRISRILFVNVDLFSAGYAPTVTPSSDSKPTPSLASRPQSSLSLSNALGLCDRSKLGRSTDSPSKIDGDEVRRNNSEAFVTDRLQEELALSNAAAKPAAERLKLKSLHFFKAMDQSILKLSEAVARPRIGKPRNDIGLSTCSEGTGMFIMIE